MCVQSPDKSLRDAWSLVKNFSRSLKNIPVPPTNKSCAEEIPLNPRPTRTPINFNLSYLIQYQFDEFIYPIHSKKNNSAPGRGGIYYSVFKNLHVDTLYKLRPYTIKSCETRLR
ncbi:hypothetical protein WA026_012321 [Henosepilachna vigintioctopunctata]|uniref:Uncharacterized protein n=1 Tax=Henosepilachna vigintioctopunctata TaxID=420089 RepID=A0AAW1UWU4_9CUCU